MTQYRAYIQSKQVYDVCGFKGANRQNIKEENLKQYIEHIENNKWNNCYRIINIETKKIVYEYRA